MIALPDYVDVVRDEYLSSFVRDGGAAVKLAVALDGVAPSDVHSALRQLSREEGYTYALVDAAAVRLHMIDKVFHAIAGQVDWDSHARSFCRSTLEGLGFQLPSDDGPFTLAGIAEANAFDEAELGIVFQRALQEHVLRDYDLAQEFRVAMVRLCLAQVDSSDWAQTDREAVLAWLRGELRLISALKQAMIFQKVVRHNARHMLVSLTRWLPKTGSAGLVLDFDIRRCAIPRRPPEPEGIYYSKAATLDAYEVLRQLIDGTDELARAFVLVLATPDFLADPKRGIDSYTALKMRIWDEVRDKYRANPLAALVRLTPDDRDGR